MFEKRSYTESRDKNYGLLLEQLKALLRGEKNQTANLANAAALLNQFLPNVNWVGFYLAFGNALVLGPFQGLPACTRIPLGKGVCGTAAKERKTLCIDDVTKFEGHIACDAASRSELVIPLIKKSILIGVLDIDSPITGRFDETETKHLSQFCNILITKL
jgi:L-methionine (R)-S-oxide reductase